MMVRYMLALILCFGMLAISSPLMATESRIVGGDGLVGDNQLAASIWRIGLCPVTAGQDFGFHIAEVANSAWPGAFAQCGAFKIINIPDCNPSALTPDDIIRLGEEYGVDALVWGSVDQAKNQPTFSFSSSNPMNEVAVMISFKLFETRTGTLLWERILKKFRAVSAYEADGVMERFAGNIVTDMVECLIADGITGRDLSLNSPPVISCPSPTITFRTSAVRLTGMVNDDFGISEVSISCGGDEAIGLWSAELATEFPLDVILTREEITGNDLTILAQDSQGEQASIAIPFDLSATTIEGNIASISVDAVFLNIGSTAGVEAGMLFTVETSVDITDPISGALLGSTCVRSGMIEVVSVEPSFSSCKVIDGKIEDLKPGDRVY